MAKCDICGKGVSVAIQAIRLDNQVENLFVWDTEIKSLTERNIYKDQDGKEVFVSEYYYEDAKDIYSMYNISTFGKCNNCRSMLRGVLLFKASSSANCFNIRYRRIFCAGSPFNKQRKNRAFCKRNRQKYRR